MWKGGGGGWPVQIRHMRVSAGEVVVRAGESTGRMKEIHLEAGLRIDPEEYTLVLRQFQSGQFEPPLVISDLDGVALLRQGGLRVDPIRLVTADSRVFLSGEVSGFSDPVLDLAFRADSLAFEAYRPG